MSKSMARRHAIQKPDETPSQIVAAYIRFDSHQQHLHSWHELQDCLERLRLWEAEHGKAAAKLKRIEKLCEEFTLIPEHRVREIIESGDG